jgi:prolyl-tRNA synthetase
MFARLSKAKPTQWGRLASSTASSDQQALRRTQMFMPTLRETPAEAALPSHRLLLRGGYIRQTSLGVYNYLPLAVRVLDKLEHLIDGAMKSVEPMGQKVSMPLLLGRESWDKTNRWQTTGEELFRLQDRHGSDYCLGPTHEEVVTELVAQNVFSYKDLPLCLYQVGRKYRDERRPRYGLMRSREFIMKDMYSFDTTEEGAARTYQSVRQAYHQFFTSLGLPFTEVKADTGNIGGNLSHEFQILAAVGEDDLLTCDNDKCGYAANVEAAVSSLSHAGEAGEYAYFEATDIEWLSGCVPEEGRPMPMVRVLVPQGRAVNPIKLLKEWAPTVDGQCMFRVSAMAPVDGTDRAVDTADTIIDVSLRKVVDIDEGVRVLDVATSAPGDRCNACETGVLVGSKGIEVGHIFYLGSKYSSTLGATFTDSNGRPAVAQMGCYGMGVSRIFAAAVEANHLGDNDDRIRWPESIAPYRVVVLTAGKQKNLREAATALADRLSQHPQLRGEVVLDDRWKDSPGMKMKEALLWGAPNMIVVGRQFVQDGTVEVERTLTGEKTYCTPDEALHLFDEE